MTQAIIFYCLCGTHSLFVVQAFTFTTQNIRHNLPFMIDLYKNWSISPWIYPIM
nr:MAG TPA: hypothetical protein [Caudoviricetes sp.]DAS73317.1 MAG TPA: hypothetical protein [Caudoviricetes sp.]